MPDSQNTPKPTILLIGTGDTKWDEMLFTERQIISHEACSVRLMDVGGTPRSNSTQDASQSSQPVLHPSGHTSPDLARADYINAMIDHANDSVSSLYKDGQIHGVIGIGGSCGTGLATAVMRKAFPVGFPKLMVSTMASGDVKPYVEETDITMMYSVVDIAGTNWILKRILSNAAAAISAMAVTFEAAQAEAQLHPPSCRKRIGVTMFGVTTPCVDRIRQYLETVHGYEVYVFHATGAGGKAMERLIIESQLDAIIDITTTEIVDELVGGVLTAGPDRLLAAAKAGIPQVISVGACDMVNFGPKDTVPEKFSNRLLHVHNPTVTLVRTDAEECRQIAKFMARKLRDHAARPDFIRVVLPTKGISLLDVEGMSFYDPQVDEVLFSTLENELQGSGISVTRDEQEINDPVFAVRTAESLIDLIRESGTW